MAQLARVADSSWTVSRTADGQPDLQGIWGNKTLRGELLLLLEVSRDFRTLFGEFGAAGALAGGKGAARAVTCPGHVMPLPGTNGSATYLRGINSTFDKSGPYK